MAIAKNFPGQNIKQADFNSLAKLLSNKPSSEAPNPNFNTPNKQYLQNDEEERNRKIIQLINLQRLRRETYFTSQKYKLVFPNLHNSNIPFSLINDYYNTKELQNNYYGIKLEIDNIIYNLKNDNKKNRQNLKINLPFFNPFGFNGFNQVSLLPISHSEHYNNINYYKEILNNFRKQHLTLSIFRRI